MGSFEEALKEKDLIKIEGDYETPIVQHCHIEKASSFAYMESGKIVVVLSNSDSPYRTSYLPSSSWCWIW